ncbi:UNVERIFIED_ORG: hypothetical protein OKW16_000547 [Pseudomonas reinekei]|nr:hypothetical protein [Pseudomonas reinekei]
MPLVTRSVSAASAKPAPNRFAWLTLPSGEKTIHAMTVPNALMFDLVPAVNERVSDLIAEAGDQVIGAGWLAHGRGAPKKKRKR